MLTVERTSDEQPELVGAVFTLCPRQRPGGMAKIGRSSGDDFRGGKGVSLPRDWGVSTWHGKVRGGGGGGGAGGVSGGAAEEGGLSTLRVVRGADERTLSRVHFPRPRSPDACDHPPTHPPHHSPTPENSTPRLQFTSVYGTIYYTDLSKYGTKVNGDEAEKDKPVALKTGDALELGSTVLVVKLVPAKADSAPAAGAGAGGPAAAAAGGTS